MMKSLLLVLLVCATAVAQEEPLVFEVSQIEEIRAAEGKQATVRGLVESTGKSRGSGINYLNFPGREFSAVVFARSLKAFTEGEPADIYKGKLVDVSGKISIYKGEPQIILDSPEQIKVIDPETEKPEPKADEPEEKVEPEPKKPAVEAPKTEPVPEKPDPGKVDPKEYFDCP